MGNCSQALSKIREGKGRGAEGRGENTPQILVTVVYPHWSHAQGPDAPPQGRTLRKVRRAKKKLGRTCGHLANLA